jgi:trehalose 6-phosphate synthase
LLGPNDLVWVHDYHLMPLARALRELGHKSRIPCPPPEILTALPHHERLTPSLCEYDLVGFQTGDDGFNFSRYLTRECGLRSHDFNFNVGGRTMWVDVFPVGIETAAFARLAQRSARLPFVRRVLESLVGRALIIGVDRLDYLKESSTGFRRSSASFKRNQTGKVTYLQIAPRAAPRSRNMPT